MLPLSFILDIKGESLGAILEPVSDDSTTGGAFSPYIKLPLADIGLRLSYFLDKNTKVLKIGTSETSSNYKDEIFGIGAFARKVFKDDTYKSEFMIILGYEKSSTKTGSSKSTVDYFAGELKGNLLGKIREGLYIGPSLDILYGGGTINWENASDKLGSDTSVFALAISPVVLNFEF